MAASSGLVSRGFSRCVGRIVARENFEKKAGQSGAEVPSYGREMENAHVYINTCARGEIT